MSERKLKELLQVCSRDLSDRDEDEEGDGRVVEDTQVVRRFVMQLRIAIAVRQGLFITESGWLSTGSIQTVVYAKFLARIPCRRGAPSKATTPRVDFPIWFPRNEPTAPEFFALLKSVSLRFFLRKCRDG